MRLLYDILKTTEKSRSGYLFEVEHMERSRYTSTSSHVLLWIKGPLWLHYPTNNCQESNMKTVIFASLITSAAAFAPAQQQRPASSLAAAPFANEVGAQVPLGYFDPLGICADGDQEKFDRLRAAEIRHGRISMLAVVGYLTTKSGFRLPGMEEMGSGFSAFDISSQPMEVRGVLPLTLFCVGMLEVFMRDQAGTAEFPGDYRNGLRDGFGWDAYSAETKLKKRAIELNNGRAAQMGILGLMVHEQLGVSILPGGI